MSREVFYKKWYQNNPIVKTYLTDSAAELLTSDKIGVYQIDFIVFTNNGNITIPAYVGETGESISVRALSHLKRFFGKKTDTYDSSLYHLGIDRSEFDEHRIKIDIRLVEEEGNIIKRLQYEETRILTMNPKPYLQDSVNGKFAKYYREEMNPRADFAIHPFAENRKNAWDYRKMLYGIA